MMRRIALYGIGAATMTSFALLLVLMVFMEAAQIPISQRSLLSFALLALAVAGSFVVLGARAIDSLLFGEVDEADEADVAILHGDSYRPLRSGTEQMLDARRAMSARPGAAASSVNQK